MAQSKKFEYRLSEKRSGWMVEIVRKISNRKTTVSKRQDGFATEEEAKQWAEATLASFMEGQVARNARKAEQRAEREAAELAAKQKAAEARAKRDEQFDDEAFDDEEFEG